MNMVMRPGRFHDFTPGVVVEFHGLRGVVADLSDHSKIPSYAAGEAGRPTWTVPVKFDGDSTYQFIYYRNLRMEYPEEPSPQLVESFKYEETGLMHDTHTGRFWKQGKATDLWFCLNDQCEAPLLLPRESLVPFYLKVKADSA